MRCPRHRGVPRPKPSRCRSCTASRRRLLTHASPMPLCIQPAPAAVPGAPPHACAAHVQATLQLLALSVAPPPMPALASTPPPALPRPPVDPIGFLVRALAHVRAATTLLPAAPVEAPLQLPDSSAAPPFMPALAFALPPALPRSPAEPTSTSLSTPSHTSTQPPPSRLQRLVWKRLCSWEPFQLGLLSHRPSPLPSLLPCRDRQPIPPAFSRLPLPTFTQSPPPRLLYRHSPLYQRPPRHVSSSSPACAVSLSRACLDPPRRKSPYSSGLYKSRLVRTSCPKVWRPSARAPCLF